MTPLNVDVLSSGGRSSWVRQIRSLGGWAFDTAFLNGHVRARGGFEKGHLVVLTVMRGGDATICGIPLEEGVVLAIPDGEEIAASIRPGVAYSAAVLPVEMWDEIVSAETGEAIPPRLPRAVRTAPESGQHLARQLAAALHCFDAAGSGATGAGVPAPFLDYLGAAAATLHGGDSLESHLDLSLRQRVRQAWLAADFIHANLHEQLSILGICRAVGVSRRQLEYAFQTTFAVGPSEYIRLTRLNESRRQLRLARARGLTVTEVAMDIGVTHLGRFSASYRLLFGETPQQTLRGG